MTLKLAAHYGDVCHLISDPATLQHKFAGSKSIARPLDETMRAFIGVP